jgi:hypothetical protein
VCVCVCVRARACVYYMCPHTTICVLILPYVSSYYYICVLRLQYIYPHTTVCVSSYYYICMLILLILSSPLLPRVTHTQTHTHTHTHTHSASSSSRDDTGSHCPHICSILSISQLAYQSSVNFFFLILSIGQLLLPRVMIQEATVHTPAVY